MTDCGIANHFNESGRLTPEGRTLTAESIKWIRHLHGIPGLFAQHNGLSVKEVAKQLNVGLDVVYYWISHGILDAKKAAPGWPWEIQMDENKEAELRDWIQRSVHLAKMKAHL